MSRITREQFQDTFDRLKRAVGAVDGAGDVDQRRAALQEVITLSESMRTAAVGYASVLGYAKRERLEEAE